MKNIPDETNNETYNEKIRNTIIKSSDLKVNWWWMMMISQIFFFSNKNAKHK